MLTDPPDNFHMDPSCQSARRSAQLPAEVIAPASVGGRLSLAAAAAPLADPPHKLHLSRPVHLVAVVMKLHHF